MKKNFLLLIPGLFCLLIFSSCQTAAEKEIARLTLPKDHPLPPLVTSDYPHLTADYFHKYNPSANSRNSSGVPILVLAAAKGVYPVTKFLMDRGADKEAADLNGCRALHAASSCGHERVTALLLQYGADVNAPGSHGRTPLMEAVRTSRKKVAGLLLAGGADVNRKDIHGRTPLMHAASAATDDGEMITLLLRKGADKSIIDEEGRTALMHAALHGNAKCAAVLLKDVPDFDRGREALGLLIMKCAIDGKNQELVKALIRKKVPLNWSRSLTHDSLKRIKMHGLYRILVRKGVLDKRRSPLMWAALNNDLAMVKLLLASGADPLQKDENGNSAYDLAVKRDVISCLKKAERDKIKKIERTQKKPLFRSKMF